MAVRMIDWLNLLKIIKAYYSFQMIIKYLILSCQTIIISKIIIEDINLYDLS